jgi:hypothetical protein
MAIFARSKRAGKAVKEPRIAPFVEPIGLLPPPPARPAPTPPIDPTKPAYTEIPIVLTAEEVRSRIAANRKRQSDIVRRSAALSYSHSHARTVSEYSLPGSGWQTHRVREPTSIEAMLQDMPFHDAELVPHPLVLRGAEPFRRGSQHSEEFHAYSNPRAVPLPPPIKTQPLPPRSRSRRLTKTKPSVPLTVATQRGKSDTAWPLQHV